MKKTVIVEEVSVPGCSELEREFRVVRAKSTLNPRVGAILKSADVEQLLADQIEVLIDLPRSVR